MKEIMLKDVPNTAVTHCPATGQPRFIRESDLGYLTAYLIRDSKDETHLYTNMKNIAEERTRDYNKWAEDTEQKLDITLPRATLYRSEVFKISPYVNKYLVVYTRVEV